MRKFWFLVQKLVQVGGHLTAFFVRGMTCVKTSDVVHVSNHFIIYCKHLKHRINMSLSLDFQQN